MILQSRMPFLMPRSTRLPDEIGHITHYLQENSFSTSLADFPLGHVYLYAQGNRLVLPCWQGVCPAASGTCFLWTLETAMSTDAVLAVLFEQAVEEYRKSRQKSGVDVDDRRGKQICRVNLIITVAWLRE